jgi:hypothetical protein
MARVYISSSFLDLREERRAVADVLISRGHLPVGMEHYRACDEAPVERCTLDAETCSHYIGVFGFRYGSILRGHSKCITELEYEAAGRKGIGRFIFLLREDVPWPADRIDRDRSTIDALRQRLRDAHTVKYFGTTAELSGYVRDVIDYEIGYGQEVPDILPYLCNRSPQEDELVDAVLASRGKPRPMVFVVHGDDRQAHDKFRERLSSIVLPRLLAAGESTVPITPYHLTWPVGASESKQTRRMLRRNLSERVLGRPDAEEADIQRHLARHPAPVMLYTYYRADDWNQSGRQSVACFLDLWKQWPELAHGQRLVVFLFVKYPSGKRGLLDRLRLRDPNIHVQRALEEYAGNGDGTPCSVLRPLHNITRQEAEDWARRDDVGEYRRTHELIGEIGELYAGWRNQYRADDIPMDDLAARLRDLLAAGHARRERAA